LKCSICKTNEASQKHHLSYQPEISIDVCVPCHKQLHNHGVGYGVGFHQVPQNEEPYYSIIGQFVAFKRKDDGKFTWVDKKDGEVLTWLICSCGRHDYHLLRNGKGEVFLVCPNCGRDYKISVLGYNEE
jgi:hypothetical protein